MAFLTTSVPDAGLQLMLETVDFCISICGTGCPSVFTAFLLPLRRTHPPFRATSLTWELLRLNFCFEHT
ncbi:hypothetical protein HYQ46_011152 [Verticillium longisporum]|nr:hypothetical protein HYQ46_011152 [Verticillium longisporum]